jgi:hypothetical protein
LENFRWQVSRACQTAGCGRVLQPAPLACKSADSCRAAVRNDVCHPSLPSTLVRSRRRPSGLPCGRASGLGGDRARHRVGDRDLASFGPADSDPGCRRANSFQLLGSTASPGVSVGDCDSVNSARPMRTRFYSARRTRDGNTTATSGDCAEMNPPALPPRPSDGGRNDYRLTTPGQQPQRNGANTM